MGGYKKELTADKEGNYPAAPSKANTRQVGGAHYASAYQHWDFVYEVLNGDYLRGCASKYAVRWRKKNGMQDLEKLAHYIQKAAETNIRRGDHTFDGQAFWLFCRENELWLLEGEVLWAVVMCDWEAARQACIRLKDEADSQILAGTAKFKY